MMRHKQENEPLFAAQRYLTSRPLYPSSIYEILTKDLGKMPTSLSFLDLGCGTGQSTLSFVRLGLAQRGVAVDCDSKMIEGANSLFSSPPHLLKIPPVDFRVGTAEALPLDDQSVDLVLIGSAVHWFSIPEAKREIERVLRPGGRLFVYEYQFPKALSAPDLNEWIRRRFNQEWKAPQQVPRGSLVEILAPFAKDSMRWRPLRQARPPWVEELSFENFLGNLFSQSRYLHAEAQQFDAANYQQGIARDIRPFFVEGPLLFDFKPRAFLTRLTTG